MLKEMTPSFRGEIIGTALKLKDDHGFKMFLSSLARKDESVPVVINVKKWRKVRSTGGPGDIGNQNGYYWKIVIPLLSEHFGYLPDEMHEAIKYKFLRIGGTDQLPKIRSTASLDTREWEDLMERVRTWALIDHDIKIPTVDDFYGLQN